MTEVLLSLRVNGLQIPPEQRRQFVDQLVKVDIFNTDKGMEFVTGLFNGNNHEIKHALSSVISIIASTTEGVKYLTHSQNNQNFEMLEKLVEMVKT